MPVSVVAGKLEKLSEEYLILVNNYIEALLAAKEKNKISARGIAAAYANPNLVPFEQDAKEHTFAGGE